MVACGFGRLLSLLAEIAIERLLRDVECWCWNGVSRILFTIQFCRCSRELWCVEDDDDVEALGCVVWSFDDVAWYVDFVDGLQAAAMLLRSMLRERIVVASSIGDDDGCCWCKVAMMIGYFSFVVLLWWRWLVISLWFKECKILDWKFDMASKWALSIIDQWALYYLELPSIYRNCT